MLFGSTSYPRETGTAAPGLVSREASGVVTLDAPASH
jgi:hypothetical protein